MTAKSEYGPDILDGSIPFLSLINLSKLVSPQRISLKNLLITLIESNSTILTRGKILRHAKTSWEKFLEKPYL